MMRFLKFAGVVLCLLGVFVLIAGLFVKRSIHCERSVIVKSSQAQIWHKVSRFSSYKMWDPLLAADSSMKIVISDNDGEVGSTYTWQSKMSGSGQLVYSQIQPQAYISMQLQLDKPIKSKANVYYRLIPQDDGVEVVCGFDGNLTYPLNAVLVLFANAESLIDTKLVAGLSHLKQLCEGAAVRVADK